MINYYSDAHIMCHFFSFIVSEKISPPDPTLLTMSLQSFAEFLSVAI